MDDSETPGLNTTISSPGTNGWSSKFEGTKLGCWDFGGILVLVVPDLLLSESACAKLFIFEKDPKSNTEITNNEITVLDLSTKLTSEYH